MTMNTFIYVERKREYKFSYNITINMSEVILSIGIIIFTIATVIALFYKHQFSYWRKRNVPHFPAVFPHGNLAGVGRIKCAAEVISEIYHAFRNNNVIVGMYMLYSPAVLLIDPEIIKAVIVQDFNAFHSRGNSNKLYFN